MPFSTLTIDQKRHIQQFRELFLVAMKPYRDMPLFLSGGVDSATSLAALLALGSQPHCYTFQLGSYESPDSKVSQLMTGAFHLKHTLVKLPQDYETLKRDILHLLPLVNYRRKTHIQCSQPFIYLAERARQDGFTDVSFAMSADDMWCVGRRGEQGVRKFGDAWGYKHRREELYNVESSDFSVVKVAAAHGISIHDPWRDKDFSEFLLSIPWKEMHLPIKAGASITYKSLAIRAFPEFWRRGSWLRSQEKSSLQLNSGVREWHDTLLTSPLNTKGYKSVIGIYNELYKGLQHGN